MKRDHLLFRLLGALASLLGVLLLVFAAGKAVFMIYNRSVGNFTLGDMANVWRHGFTMDLSTSCYLLAVPWLCGFIFLVWRRFPLRRVLLPYFFVVGMLLGLIICGDAFLYEFWKFKLNATVFSYMSNPEGVVSSVSTSFMVSRLLGILAFGLLAFGLMQGTFRQKAIVSGSHPCHPFSISRHSSSIPRHSIFISRHSSSVSRHSSPLSHRLFLIIAWLLVGGLVFVGIRGGVGRSVMNLGVPYFCQDLFLNHSAVNPAFSLFASMSKSKDFDSQFDYLPEAERAQAFEGLYPQDTEDVADTLLNVQRPNVLIVLMESFGGKFIRELDGLPDVAPNMSRLIPQGIFWTNYYSNSFRTDRGIVSALSGWVSYPTTSLMRLPEKLNYIPSIAQSLAREGYSTTYLYGGDIRVFGQRGYLLQTGYETLVSDADFPLSQAHESKWGVNDSLSALRALQLVCQMPQERPWHLVWQTLSSHEPFEVPYHMLRDKTLNAFAFTDHCIGQFIDSLRTKPQWKDLLVILIPDHGFLYDLTYQDPAFFHSPMLWLGGAIRHPRRMDVLLNQSDLAATLLGQMGLPHSQFPWSRNVLSNHYTYPFAYSNYPGGILFADSTGVSVYDITANEPITEQPAPSTERLRRTKAILQTSYDRLGENQ